MSQGTRTKWQAWKATSMLAVTCCEYFDIICAAGISHWPIGHVFFCFRVPSATPKQGRTFAERWPGNLQLPWIPHDFCVGGLSDEPNCRVNSLGNSCDGYLWWNLVGFPTETSYLVTSHIFAAASGTWQELADTNWRPGDAGESSRRYGFVWEGTPKSSG